MNEEETHDGGDANLAELTSEQIEKVDAILRCWPMAGECLLRRDGDPSMSELVAWTVPVDGLVRMLHTLAHCAAMCGMQDLVAGRTSADRKNDMVTGFIAAAKAVEYLASRCQIKDVKLCSADPHEYLNGAWNEIAESRAGFIDDIERVAPGWYAKAQELAAKAKEKSVKTVPVTSAAGHVVAPDSGYAERVAKARAGIRRKGLGEIRIDNVFHRLYVHLDEPQELLRWNHDEERAKIKAELAKTWMPELVTFIGEYESRYGERLSDNEIRYLRELVSGDMTTDKHRGYARLVGLESRDTRLKLEDFQ